MALKQIKGYLRVKTVEVRYVNTVKKETGSVRVVMKHAKTQRNHSWGEQIMTSDPMVQVYLTTEDGMYFDLRMSDGNVSFDIWDMHENDINRFISDIQEFVELLKESYDGFR